MAEPLGTFTFFLLLLQQVFSISNVTMRPRCINFTCSMWYVTFVTVTLQSICGIKQKSVGKKREDKRRYVNKIWNKCSDRR